MPVGFTYAILCIPVEGDVFIINPFGSFKYFEDISFNGIVMNVKNDTEEFWDMYEFVDGEMQNRYTNYTRDGKIMYDGFIGLNEEVEGEFITY